MTPQSPGLLDSWYIHICDAFITECGKKVLYFSEDIGLSSAHKSYLGKMKVITMNNNWYMLSHKPANSIIVIDKYVSGAMTPSNTLTPVKVQQRRVVQPSKLKRLRNCKSKNQLSVLYLTQYSLLQSFYILECDFLFLRWKII